MSLFNRVLLLEQDIQGYQFEWDVNYYEEFGGDVER
jgi:hypothetical protein